MPSTSIYCDGSGIKAGLVNVSTFSIQKSISFIQKRILWINRGIFFLSCLICSSNRFLLLWFGFLGHTRGAQVLRAPYCAHDCAHGFLIPGCTHGLLLVVLKVPYEVLGFEPGLASMQGKYLVHVCFLQPLKFFKLRHHDFKYC